MIKTFLRIVFLIFGLILLGCAWGISQLSGFQTDNFIKGLAFLFGILGLLIFLASLFKMTVGRLLKS